MPRNRPSRPAKTRTSAEGGLGHYPLFPRLCEACGLPRPVPEYRFHPTRKWRLDFAWVAQKVGLEVEGGVFVRGRHSRGAGMVKDMEKYNEATASGWKVFRVTPQQLMTKSTLDLLRRVLT